MGTVHPAIDADNIKNISTHLTSNKPLQYLELSVDLAWTVDGQNTIGEL